MLQAIAFWNLHFSDFSFSISAFLERLSGYLDLLCVHSVHAFPTLLSSHCCWLSLHDVPASDASPTLGFASVLRQFQVELPALPNLWFSFLKAWSTLSVVVVVILTVRRDSLQMWVAEWPCLSASVAMTAEELLKLPHD